MRCDGNVIGQKGTAEARAKVEGTIKPTQGSVTGQTLSKKGPAQLVGVINDSTPTCGEEHCLVGLTSRYTHIGNLSRITAM